MPDKILDTVLLLALPASGKSEVRKYLRLLPADECRKDFHMGETSQLDDFIYVHAMRRIDDELMALGEERLFFISADRSFKNPRDWGTLIRLVGEDYANMVARKKDVPASFARDLFDRIDRASVAVGIEARMGVHKEGVLEKLAGVLEKEARELQEELWAAYPESLEGRSLVIEFARGGKDGSSMPLSAPFGYQYSIGQLPEDILSRAVILYIWVTPEESRRKNDARTDPNDPGSILHHGVPLEVMLGDYGCDDMDWLEQNAQRPGTITVQAHGKTFHLPIARFDNRVDKTSFIRDEKKDWKSSDVEAVHNGLKGALEKLSASLLTAKT